MNIRKSICLITLFPSFVVFSANGFAAQYLDTIGNFKTLLTVSGSPHPYAGEQIVPGINLSGVDLSNADLREANLSRVNLSGATLANANLSKANFDDINLEGANLTGVISGGITGIPSVMATDFRLVDGFLVGPGAVLSGVNLSSQQLSGINLSNAKLDQANLVSTELSDSKLMNIDLSGANLMGAFLIDSDLSEANLESADLRNANLNRANLNNANLVNVNVRGANLIGTNLDGVTLTGISYDVSSTGLLEQILKSWEKMVNLEQIADLRPGSILIQVVDGSATVEMDFQVSSDLTEWADTGERFSVTIPVDDEQVKWLRFASQ